MGLAGEPGQNLRKEMGCRQNIDNVRLSGMELDLRMNFLSPLRGFVVSHLYPGLAPWAAIFRRLVVVQFEELTELFGRLFALDRSKNAQERVTVHSKFP